MRHSFVQSTKSCKSKQRHESVIRTYQCVYRYNKKNVIIKYNSITPTEQVLELKSPASFNIHRTCSLTYLVL